MKIIYAQQDIPGDLGISIFLAGPSPHHNTVESWRPKAIRILQNLGYDGGVFIPEPENLEWNGDYNHQIEWEWKVAALATCIVFWVPREMQNMPAFTTNIEWGKWYESGKVVLGYPENTPKMSYFDFCAKKNNIPVSNNLEDTLKSALTKIMI